MELVPCSMLLAWTLAARLYTTKMWNNYLFQSVEGQKAGPDNFELFWIKDSWSRLRLATGRTPSTPPLPLQTPHDPGPQLWGVPGAAHATLHPQLRGTPKTSANTSGRRAQELSGRAAEQQCSRQSYTVTGLSSSWTSAAASQSPSRHCRTGQNGAGPKATPIR
jgi:hypothetical protein